MVLELDSSM